MLKGVYGPGLEVTRRNRYWRRGGEWESVCCPLEVDYATNASLGGLCTDGNWMQPALSYGTPVNHECTDPQSNVFAQGSKQGDSNVDWFHTLYTHLSTCNLAYSGR